MASSPAGKPRPSLSLDWLGLAPFFIFAFFFIALPSSNIIVRSFLNDQGNPTLENISALADANIIDAYTTSIQISLITALMGGLLGFLVAYAIVIGGIPRWVRTIIVTFSSLTSQFGGVPLAFAFIATIGRTGFLTAALNDAGINILNLSRSSELVLSVVNQLNSLLGPPVNFLAGAICRPIDLFNFQFALCQYSDFNLYDVRFNLYTVLGLSLTYMYFQFPLMVLIMAPALEGLKPEWREASENLGANQWQYWRHVAFPVLLPSLLGTILLLFANAFGAQATAFALTGGAVNLVTIVLGAQIRGDVLRNPGLGYALAMGMLTIMSVCIIGYTLLQRQSERWLRR